MFIIVPDTIISTFHILTNLFLLTTLQCFASIYRGGTDAWNWKLFYMELEAYTTFGNSESLKSGDLAETTAGN